MSFQQRLEGERCVLKMARGRAPRQSEQQVSVLVWEPGWGVWETVRKLLSLEGCQGGNEGEQKMESDT